MKEMDYLIEQIMQVFEDNGNKYLTATGLVNKIYKTHGADSNHEHYRKVLRRLNKMNENGYMDVKYINPYIATKWRVKKG